MKQFLSVLLVLLFSCAAFAQKTVKVREYRRKDGTVVRAHDRRPPKSSRPSQTIPFEPYATIDLGNGSFYTPGGTGIIRPRRVFPDNY